MSKSCEKRKGGGGEKKERKGKEGEKEERVRKLTMNVI